LKAKSLARRYAKALMGIGIDNDSYEQLTKELAEWGELFAGHDGLVGALENPSYSLAKRRAVVDGLIDRFEPSPTVKNFLLLALENGRVALIPDIAAELQNLADERAGRLRAEVIAARKEDLDDLTQLQAALEQTTGKKVVLTSSVDERLIAGKVTRIGSTVLDGSIRTRLDQLGSALLEGKI
jgi:F-type H+-transporting ATPase subunit delta